jgi:hypothetical protein
MYMSHSKHIAAYVLSQGNKVLCCSNLNKHTVMKTVTRSELLINCRLSYLKHTRSKNVSDICVLCFSSQ